MNKVAFITMDVESFFDTTCLRKKLITDDEKYNCAKEVGKFIDYLNEQNIKSTLFLNLDFLKECKDDITKAVNTGHEIAIHSLIHNDLSKLKDGEFLKIINESKEAIKQQFGQVPTGFRFPCFDFKERQLKILEDSGFLYDSSLIRSKNKSYKKINDVVYKKDGLYEFAPNRDFLFFKKVVFSGGGLLRMLPWKYAKKRIKRIIRKNDSYLFYVHPFELSEDELPVYKSLAFYDKIYIRRNRKIWFSCFKEIIELLKEEGYIFMTMSDFISSRCKNG